MQTLATVTVLALAAVWLISSIHVVESFVFRRASLASSSLKLTTSTCSIALHSIGGARVADKGIRLSMKAASPIDSYKSKAKSLQQKLANAGTAGIAAYGFLNGVYYSSVMTVVWIASVKELKTSLSAVQLLSQRTPIVLAHMSKVIALVWAGSQITKLFRLSGAIVLSPVADKVLNWITSKFNIQSNSKLLFYVTVSLLSPVIMYYGLLVAWALLFLGK